MYSTVSTLNPLEKESNVVQNVRMEIQVRMMDNNKLLICTVGRIYVRESNSVTLYMSTYMSVDQN